MKKSKRRGHVIAADLRGRFKRAGGIFRFYLLRLLLLTAASLPAGAQTGTGVSTHPATIAAADGARTLSWAQAVRMLEENNPGLISARARVEAAKARYMGGYSRFLPALSMAAGYDRSGPAPGDSYSYDLSGSLSLFSGGADAAELRSRKWGLKKSRAELRLAQAGASYDLCRAFVKVISAQAAIKLSDGVVERRLEQVQLIRLKYRAGIESEAALLETEARLGMAEWEREREKKNLRLAQRALNRVLGQDLAAAVGVKDFPPIPELPAGFAAFRSEALKHPSLLSRQYQINMSRQTLARARSGFFPKGTLAGRHGWSGPGMRLGDRRWNAGVTLNWEFFSGGGTRQDVKAAKAGIAAALGEMHGASDSVMLEAEDSFLSWRQAHALIKVRQTLLEARKARAWLVQNQYVSGKSTYFEWRNSEEALTGAENDLLSARMDLITAWARFEKAMGRGIKQ